MLKPVTIPPGMDKILVSSDGEVCVSNDGATILERMEVENEIAKVVENAIFCSHCSYMLITVAR